MSVFGIAAIVKPGTIQGWGGTTAPDGWLICDGSAISRELYPELFAVIGTRYGEGDGETTFNIPNGVMSLGTQAPVKGDHSAIKLQVVSGSDVGARHELDYYNSPTSDVYLTFFAGPYPNGKVGLSTEDSGIYTDLTSATAASTAIIKY